jgi:transcriptional regulator with PAS, ATPase and Fis domain
VLDSSASSAFASLLGDDPELQRERERAQLYAATDLPVLLLAETGTGKELFARAIHAASPRSDGPFIAVNCGSIPETLLASELFGHAPHAFTGANRRGAEGKLSAADGGTLFLDEAADMSPALQCALLRFLDDGSYQRVGETQLRRANVRIVCATCRDLLAHVESGKFRQDLFYRIQGACISPPPLRMRSDRLLLARQLLDQLGGGSLSPSAQQHILTHDWPGNVRELKSALQHARALARGELIEGAHLPRPLLGQAGAPPNRRTTPAAESAAGTVVPRKQVLRDAVQDALRATNGNLSEAARLLRMSRTTLYRMLKQT